MNKGIKALIILLFMAGIGLCLFYINSGSPTARESTLIGVILSIFSILATWIVTHVYTDRQHQKAIEDVQEFHRSTLQTYAKKAAEKVNNLSNELTRLSAYLIEELDRSDMENPNELLLTREERMSSAIHIVNTLKSVNDTALSDWEGVIGDLLDKQREEKQVQFEELKDLISRIQEISETSYDVTESKMDGAAQIKDELESIRKEMRSITAGIGVTQYKARKPQRKARVDVELECIECRSLLKYRQRPKSNGFKSIVCPKCGARLLSRYSEIQGFYLELRKILPENIKCPDCNSIFTCELDNLPGSNLELICENCENKFRISRTIKSVNIKRKGPLKNKDGSDTPHEREIDLIKKHLPEQPWPKGIHKTVADKCELSNTKVQQAIQVLIKKGVFNPQVDGKVYVPLETNKGD